MPLLVGLLLLLSATVPTKTLVASLPFRADEDCWLRLSADGSRLLVGQSGRISLIAVPQGRHIWRKAGGLAAFGPKDSVLLARKNRLDRYDARSGGFIGRFETPGTTATSIAFSPDGARVFATDSSSTFACWSLRDGKRLWRQYGPGTGEDRDKLGEALILVSDGRDGVCAINNRTWKGEPMRSDWLIESFDKDGHSQGRQDGGGLFEHIEHPWMADSNTLAALEIWGSSETHPLAFRLPALSPAQPPKIPIALNPWFIEPAGQDLLVVSNGDSLVRMSPAGNEKELELGRKKTRDPDLPETYMRAEEIDCFAGSADSRVIALNDREKLRVYRVRW